jgi:dihydrolipoamide dehydrogenase
MALNAADRMSAMVASYDVVILGAGSGGYACALRAAQLGLSVAMVEKDKIGGTCLHRGCIPTKALLHAAEVADAARNGSQLGVHATVDKIDLAGIQDYAASVVNRIYSGLTGLVKAGDIAVVSGEGRLVSVDGKLAVRVDDEDYVGGYLVLASGSFPRTLAGVEVDGDRVINSDHALKLGQLPSSAIVLGGGVIGVEFASAWRSLGVEVTVVEAMPHLVPTEDPAISTALERAFRRRGIGIRTGVAVHSCQASGDAATVRLADGSELSDELVLMAVGRGPYTEGLGYAEAGVRLRRGFVDTDERLRASVPSTYAVGDLVAGPQLAHRGFAHGIFVAEEIGHLTGRLSAAPLLVKDSDIPRVSYCDPEIATVGLSEEAARAAYGEVETLTYDLAGNGRSRILKTGGFVKLIRRSSGPVVGIHMIGSRVGELIGEAQLINGWEAHPSDVAPYVHAHPTQNEALGEAHLALAGKPLHSHG